MTWIPCTMCGQVWCCCNSGTRPSPVNAPAFQPTYAGTITWPSSPPKLSDDDVKRIAKELYEHLKLAGAIVKALPANEAADADADKAVAAIPRKRRKLRKR